MKGHAHIACIILSFFFLAGASCNKSDDPSAEVPTFDLTFPEDGATGVALTPELRWNSPSPEASFTVQLSMEKDFSVIAFENSGIMGTQFTVEEPLQVGYRYYWRVIALVNGESEKASESVFSFRTQSSAPEASPTVSSYWVSPNGVDNPDRGSAERPFQSLAYAAGRVPAGEGDTIRLSAGTFSETEPCVIPIGVNVLGAGQDQTILSSRGVTIPEGVDTKSLNFHLWYDGALIQLVSRNRNIPRNPGSTVLPPEDGNQFVKGFTIDGNNKSLKAGLWVENRNNVTVSHVTIKSCAQRGAVFAAVDKPYFKYPAYYMTGIKIHDCTFINSGKDMFDQTLGNLCIAQLDGAEIYNIHITDNEGYGIKFIHDGYFKNLTIRDCTIELNEVDEKWGEDIAIELWNLGPDNSISNIECNTWLSIVNHAGMFGDASYNHMIVSNIRMRDKDGISTKEAIEIGTPGAEISDSYFENKGIGIAIWDMGRENIVVRNNIFYNSIDKDNWADGAAIYIDNSRDWDFRNIGIYNNVFDNHKVSVRLKGNRIFDIDIANNLFMNARLWEAQVTGENISFRNNWKYSSSGDQSWYLSGEMNKTDNLAGDPKLLQSGSRLNNYYVPVNATSPLADKGVDVGFPFTGVAPDIGYLEVN
jgi:hypothetical protein